MRPPRPGCDTPGASGPGHDEWSTAIRDTARRRADEGRLAAYLDGIGAALGHAGRAAALRAYCTGLLLPGKRKSVELLAARVEPARVQAVHQALHHFVANAAWDDAAVLAAVRARVWPALERRGPPRHWIVDELYLPKQGTHSAGVAVQSCARSGKRGNHQVAVSLWAANDAAALPLAHRLYLPRDWADDPARRAKAGVPAGVGFETEAEIALGLLRRALADGLPAGVVLGDACHGGDTGFRAGVDGLGLGYVLGVPASCAVRPRPVGRRGAAPSAGEARAGHSGEGGPIAAAELARHLPPRAWRKAGRRGGRRAAPPSRFAAVRVHPAGDAPPRAGAPHPESHPGPPRGQPAEVWLLVEWPEHDPEPAGYWLSNLPASVPLAALVAATGARRRAERDRQELEQDVGLAHYEGRGWLGFHHHASLCTTAYGFLVAERCLFPPSRRFSPGRLALPELPQGFRPRGAAPPAFPVRAADPPGPAAPDDAPGA